ncbi:MAG: transketolase family protein [Clostridia bacterium]|nr:transketolase family protein [Clostridia bacterium]
MGSTRQAYGEALAYFGRQNKNIVVLDADVAKATKTEIFKKEFPDRFFDMGIAEADMIGTAAGLATCGKTVFASSFAIFAVGRAFEQIRNSVAYPNLNVKVAATHSGISVGEDGATHQAIEDIALMRAVPNIKIIVPCDQYETKWAVKTAIETDGPFYIRLGRCDVPDVYSETESFTFGKGKTLVEGNDITIVATGMMVSRAVDAANALKNEGISARVIDMHTIKPIDEDILVKAATETKKIFTVEEHNILGGLGGAACEVVAEKCPTKVIRIGVNDEFGQSGKAEELLKLYGLDVDGIVGKVKENL